ncbi:16S rRNA (cytosine(1402)-N(4))-methyltransferase RsmH [Candidatus Shapirobacteria bacterium]|nr:16S rRNA (cytosine(1402)-N(4))-methyltransferase RsmH [Candidatus Shapirobacteria bacterium]
MKLFHQPVLLPEVLQALRVKKGGKYIDATVGGGGHAQAFLKLSGKILGLDCDPEALNHARESLSTACPSSALSRGPKASWRLVRANFKDLAKVAKMNGFDQADGVLLDLGVSSYQLETPQRGFSFKSPYPLDMRMDPDLKVTAADLINGLGKNELKKLFEKLGEEKLASRLAEALVSARRVKPILSCQQLADVVLKVKRKKGKIHPATQVFQALRIAVNDELNNLREALPGALEILKTGGRLAVISFHSGEDRLVKDFFKDQENQGDLKILTKKPLRPSWEEMKANPRSRSAKLRVGEKK